MIAKQHIANYSSCEPMTNHFLTTKQLLSIPWIHQYTTYENFYRFSLCNDKDDYSLMAEINKGKDWWVVCDLIGITKKLNLPKFKNQ